MPMAFIYVGKDLPVSEEQTEKLMGAWSSLAKISLKDITVTVMEHVHQAGKAYKAMVRLCLPSRWEESDVRRITMSLHEAMVKTFHLPAEDIVILTSLLESGKILDRGKIIEW
ncbi:hypothetical protein [Gorillibacterium sp. sgz5001074]|uniref:hypothetical protein n=1 Tax=Gorillibacterium sp. sgz5001074 TaxID=3446695 RepID=UPI003F6743DC